MHRKYKYLTLGLGAGIIPIILTASGAVGGGPVSAINQPSVEIKVPDSISSGTLAPNINNPHSVSKFYTPVTFIAKDVSEYTVSIEATSDLDLKGKTNTDNILHSVTSTTGIPISSMDNKWGYYAAWSDDDNHNEEHLYARVPTANTIIDTRTPHGDETKTLNLNFAARVDGSQPADTYTGEVSIKVVYSPEYTTLFDMNAKGLTMQDMTPSICALTHTPSSTATEAVTTKADADARPKDPTYGTIDKVPEVTLTDKRDGKTYLIRKLADGNCWMSQNLEFDFLGNSLVGATGQKQDYAYAESYVNGAYTGTEVTWSFELTTGNTDITPILADTLTVTNARGDKVWTPADSSIPVYATIIGARWGGNTAYGWGPAESGLRSISYAATTAKCTEQTIANNALGSTTSAVCPNVFKATYTVVTQTGTDTRHTALAVSDTGKPDERNGNLYNYSAATLGTSVGLTGASDDVVSSICPRGWKLPSSTKEGRALFSAYGLTTYSIANLNRFIEPPLSFITVSYYRGYDGNIQSGSGVANYYTGTTSGPGHGMLLEGFSSVLSYSYPGDDFNGAAVRCVAR